MSPSKDTSHLIDKRKRFALSEKICDARIHLFPDRLMEAILHWFVQQGWTMPDRIKKICQQELTYG